MYMQWLILHILSIQSHLKQLIRRGIPRDYRPEVWKWVVRDTLKESYMPGKYFEILKTHVSLKLHVHCACNFSVLAVPNMSRLWGGGEGLWI